MERVETDDDDRPVQEIKITGATIFVNPYKEMEEAEKKAAEEARLKVIDLRIGTPLSTISPVRHVEDLHLYLDDICSQVAQTYLNCRLQL